MRMVEASGALAAARLTGGAGRGTGGGTAETGGAAGGWSGLGSLRATAFADAVAAMAP